MNGPRHDDVPRPDAGQACEAEVRAGGSANLRAGFANVDKDANVSSEGWPAGARMTISIEAIAGRVTGRHWPHAPVGHSAMCPECRLSAV